ncbi:type IV secretory system conjugative DNA transfer family protein [Litorihabitans aurantiacus]|uniref:TraD/TraG TraM recognition site domain-containing protein n=1 Tax=Litorihabitans aurantiacus TaxID=1930061 RepID=A0AA37XI73_9MICO|nr:type IV secretory system conjugative DNA transfer family protein [Litorihabitans aurantiacus]GMA33652.1 hypothetical protein GCM10025875_36440 [Litorihabitans aurantiacus]GMA33719.1 hypothetical protein GCM10025875_37110 [Litorihabitans aurantiacus]GMA33783.1 hypothetical protein GCM10025875_37750 [Litorihabitans aurantiacus]
MNGPNNRREDPGQSRGQLYALMVLVGLVVLVVVGVNAGVRLGNRFAGTPVELSGNPMQVVLEVFTGAVAWPAAGTAVVVVLGVLVLAVVVLLALAFRRIARHRSRVDDKARYMGRGRDISSLTAKASRATSQRLGAGEWLGVALGRSVSGGQALYASAEDQIAMIAGPRMGKSTSFVIGAIVEAPGAVITTSNKRDVVDATRDVRKERGPVWVFDPQGVAEEPATWWWDPLSYVTDEMKADRLAGHFAEGSREEGAGKGDAHFDGSGRTLLGALFLAAAMTQTPITQVYTWLTNPRDERQVQTLREHGFPRTADALYGIVNTPDRERGSIFSTARRMAKCLTNRSIDPWITANGSGDPRPQLDPAKLLDDGGTLYSLSMEGEGSAGPLVTALTVAVVEAAEEKARRSPGGRLPTPLLGILDEAANVCRWKQLPSLYSHFGSKGIVLATVLQSWAQGVDVWGDRGMEKLWSAANVRLYLGNNTEVKFLSDLSTLIGNYDRLSSSASTTRGQRTRSDSLSRERVLDVDDLSALPRGRAVLLSAGNRPTLVRTVPWLVGPHAEAIRASIKAHDPQAGQTVARAERDLAETTDELGPVPGVQAA